MTKTNAPLAIRLSLTPEVKAALRQAKRQYPTLSDPEILKLGLAKIVTEDKGQDKTKDDISRLAAHAVGEDYLNDPAEDIYRLGMGKKTGF